MSDVWIFNALEEITEALAAIERALDEDSNKYEYLINAHYLIDKVMEEIEDEWDGG